MARAQAKILAQPVPTESTLHRLRAALPPPLRAAIRSARQIAVSSRLSGSPEAPLSTGVEPIDRLLAGGLPRGRLVELTGRRSCGRFSTLLSLLTATTRRGESAAFVDLGHGFDPRTAHDAGIVLERLLWIRPQRVKEALISAEITLHTGFPLVVLDLGTPPVPGGRGYESSWLRLARAAKERRSALFVSSPYRVSGTAASTVLAAGESRPAWHREGLSPGLLVGLRGLFSVQKSRASPTAAAATEAFRFSTLEGLVLRTAPFDSQNRVAASPATPR